MRPNRLIVLAGILGAAAVALGAIGSHALPNLLQKEGLSDAELARRLDLFETATRYHILHALALLALAVTPAEFARRRRAIAASLFTLGIVLFSGGLYSMAVFDVMGNPLIVPAGGICFIAGWLAAAAIGLGRGTDESP